MVTNKNTPEVTENINKLLELKHSVYTEMYSHENEIKRLKFNYLGKKNNYS